MESACEHPHADSNKKKENALYFSHIFALCR